MTAAAFYHTRCMDGVKAAEHAPYTRPGFRHPVDRLPDAGKPDIGIQDAGRLPA